MIYDKDEVLAEIAKLEAKIRRYEDGEYTYSEEQEYKEMLDECYPEYKFGDCIYYPSNILQSCDPNCFKIGMEEYFDSRLEDLKPELEELQDNLEWLETAEVEAKIQRYKDGEYTHADREEYKEYLDNSYPDVNIKWSRCGYGTYSASTILENCDPIAFKIGMEEYFDGRLEDLRDSDDSDSD
ncbi:MAG: hypothetical protein ACRC2J_17545 [Microcoleaceae cyanobacterium]